MPCYYVLVFNQMNCVGYIKQDRYINSTEIELILILKTLIGDKIHFIVSQDRNAKSNGLWK